MPQFAPISYGPAVQADLQGADTALRATAQHEAAFQQARELGSTIEGGANVIAQGLLHNQALAATADVKEKQADTLKFIESTPNVTKAQMADWMTPEDLDAWAAKNPGFADKEVVPMYAVAGDLYDSKSRQTRETAGASISLPGWREKWNSAERVDSAVYRDRYVNRAASEQMVGDQRAKWLTNVDRLIDAGAFAEAEAAAQNSPWAHPAEREAMTRKVLAGKDSFAAENSMRSADIEGMKQELDKLRGPKAAEDYPNLTETQRRTLTDTLNREYNHVGVDKVAADIVEHNTTSVGNVDSDGIKTELDNYKGPNRANVLKAVNQQEAEARNIWNRKATQLQDSVRSAGMDPDTREFSLTRAQRDPGVRHTLDLLQKTDPKLVGQLYLEDVQNQRRDLTEANAEERRAAADLKRESARASGENYFAAKDYLSNEANMAELSKLTPSQWAGRLADQSAFPGGFTDADKRRALDMFTSFQKKGGAYVQQARSAVKDELSRAFRDDPETADQYVDVLRNKAHGFLMENAGTDPLKLDDMLHKYVRDELLQGSVKGGGTIFGDENGVRRIDWETDPKKSTMPFVMPDGTVIKPRVSNVNYEVQRVDGRRVTVSPGEAIDLVGDGGSITGTVLPNGKKVDTSASMNTPDLAPLVPDEKTRDENLKKATPEQREAVDWLKANKDHADAPAVRAVLLKLGLL